MLTAEQKVFFLKMAKYNPEMAQLLNVIAEKNPEIFILHMDHLMAQVGPYRTFTGSNQIYYFHGLNDGTYHPPEGFVPPVASVNATSSVNFQSNATVLPPMERDLNVNKTMKK